MSGRIGAVRCGPATGLRCQLVATQLTTPLLHVSVRAPAESLIVAFTWKVPAARFDDVNLPNSLMLNVPLSPLLNDRVNEPLSVNTLDLICLFKVIESPPYDPRPVGLVHVADHSMSKRETYVPFGDARMSNGSGTVSMMPG